MWAVWAAGIPAARIGINKKLKCNLAKIIGTLFAKFITGR